MFLPHEGLLSALWSTPLGLPSSWLSVLSPTQDDGEDTTRVVNLEEKSKGEFPNIMVFILGWQSMTVACYGIGCI